MQIKEIKTSDKIAETFLVLTQIYQNLSSKTYIDNVLKLFEQGYKMAAVFEDQDVEDGRCIGVIGVRVSDKLKYDKALEIEDFMIDRKKRGVGVGKMLLRWADWQATILKCDNIVCGLDTKRQESQKIFSREKFILEGFLFSKNC